MNNKTCINCMHKDVCYMYRLNYICAKEGYCNHYYEDKETNIAHIIVNDDGYEFDGILDKNRQLIYAKPYAAEYVKNVLGMTWKEDNSK